MEKRNGGTNNYPILCLRNVLSCSIQYMNLIEILSYPGMCFDTTNTNSGANKGACTLLEQKLGRRLYAFACRHHVYELPIAAVYNHLFDKPNGPDIQLFVKFKNSWQYIDRTKWKTAMEDEDIANILEPDRDDLIQFILDQLSQFHPRDDYRELLNFSLQFLNFSPSKHLPVHAPGACHRARWMAKAIYCLKIFMFRDQFNLTAGDLQRLRKFNVFFLKVYLKKWYESSCPVRAAQNDLNFLKEIINYKNVNKTVSNVALESFSRHLWYLSENLAGLSLFDSRIPCAEKKKIVEALLKPARNPEQRRIKMITDANSASVSDFITCQSRKIFDDNDISLDFLESSPELWDMNDVYLKSRSIAKKFRVVNDVAERYVKLAQDYNNSLVMDQNIRDELLLVVADHRKNYKRANKINYAH